MRKKLIWTGATLILLLLIGLGGLFLFHKTYIVADGQVYSRKLEVLDLSGTPVTDLDKITELKELKKLDLRDTGLTAEEYLLLRQALPNCVIQWSVPFQNEYYDESTGELTVTALKMEELEQLKFFPELTMVDATDCRDYEALLALKAAFPELNVQYNVFLGGVPYREDTAALVLENADIRELEAALPYLPELERVEFSGAVPENEEICRLKEQYPAVTFVWDFELFGVSANSMDEELILSGIPMESVDAVEAALKCFYNLKWVEMCDCGIPSEEMDALWKRHPETRFVWTVQIGVCKLRTDVTTFMPYKFGYDGYSKLFDKHMAEMKYCVDLVCLDMGHMGISDYSFLEYMPNMKYLILAGTEGTDFSALAYLKELVFLELFMTKFDQAEVLTGLTKLEDLNIGNSGLDNIEPLKKMTWLKRLWLPSTRKVWYVERDELREALPDTIVNFSGMGSTDEGWRESPNYYAMRDMLGMGYLPGYQ